MKLGRLRAPFIAFVATIAIAQAPSPATGAEPDVRDVRDAMRFRETFGLSTDRAAVEAIEANRSASRAYGVALTASEAAEMARRESFAERLSPAVPKLRAEPTFGGMFIDQARGGKLVVNLVNGSHADKERIAGLVPSDGQVEFRDAKHTLRALDAAYEAMNAALPALESRGLVIHEVELSERENVLRVGLDRLDEAWIAEVEDVLDPGIVEFFEADPLNAGACSRTSCPSPERLRAGLVIGAAGEVCTSGFIVHNGTNSQMLTAAHCFKYGGVGQTVYHAGVSIGQVSDTLLYDYSDGDVKMINIPNTRESNWIYNQFAILTPDISTAGKPICRSGIASGVDCGVILETRNTTGYDGYHFVNQGKTDFGSADGDSGGPMYASGNKAYGVFASFTSTRSWYARLEYVEPEFNNYVCIDINCTY